MKSMSRPVWLALAVTILLTAYALYNDQSGSGDGGLRPMHKSNHGENSASTAVATASMPLSVRASHAPTPDKPLADLFAAKSWQPPPPPQPKPKPVRPFIGPLQPPPPPPPPQAPPLDNLFKVIGRFYDGENITAYLSYQGSAVALTTGPRTNGQIGVGDVLGGTYRVDAITATQVTFMYLPYSQAQVLRIGG